MSSFHAYGRAFAVTMSLVATALLSACGQPPSSYVFSADPSEISLGEAAIDVRIVHAPTNKPVENAVIFETRFDMSPDAMEAMTAPVTAEGSPSPGIYRFGVKPTMAGRWALKLSAKVQGEVDAVTGSVVVTARQ